jgi:hypothetical protein
MAFARLLLRSFLDRSFFFLGFCEAKQGHKMFQFFFVFEIYIGSLHVLEVLLKFLFKETCPMSMSLFPSKRHSARAFIAGASQLH